MPQLAQSAPLDVRLMNLAASVAFLGVFVLLLVAAGWWAVRHPAFAITRIVMRGDMVHNNPLALRANVAPYLTGNFFTIQLAQAREAFEQLPWVRLAEVRRQFPNGLGVTLHEHVPLAFWGPESGTTMVNTRGEVFDTGQSHAELLALPPAAAAEDDDGSGHGGGAPTADAQSMDFARLPRLSGPSGTAPQVIEVWRMLDVQTQGMGLQVTVLTWRDRGSWRAQLSNGADMELGGGTMDELRGRVQRFVRVLAEVLPRYRRNAAALEYADLRYRDGFALRLRGVGTVQAGQASSARN